LIGRRMIVAVAQQHGKMALDMGEVKAHIVEVKNYFSRYEPPPHAQASRVRPIFLVAFLAFFWVTVAHGEIIPGNTRPTENAAPVPIDFGKIGVGDRRKSGDVDAPPILEPRLLPNPDHASGAHIIPPLSNEVSPVAGTAPNTAPIDQLGKQERSDPALFPSSQQPPSPAAVDYDDSDWKREAADRNREEDAIVGYIFIGLMVLGVVGLLVLLFTSNTSRLAVERLHRKWK
jgi:hypothetical protein